MSASGFSPQSASTPMQATTMTIRKEFPETFIWDGLDVNDRFVCNDISDNSIVWCSGCSSLLQCALTLYRQSHILDEVEDVLGS